MLLVLAMTFVQNVAFAAPPPPLANAVIIIIRHAERQTDGDNLTPAGLARAQAYVKYFESYKVNSRPRPPDYLIAAADSTHSERTRLTLTPLSQAMKLPLDLRFKNKHVDDLAQALTTTSTGKTILICWHHEKISDLLTALGANPNTLIPNDVWPEDKYDWVIQLQYDANGKLIPSECVRINEHLMPGDPL
jgi:hypothetical protein